MPWATARMWGNRWNTFIKMQGKRPPHGKVKSYEGVFRGIGDF